MISKYSFKRCIPLIIAIIFLLYFIFCSIIIGFNFFVFVVFFIIISLNLGLFYITTHIRDDKKIAPRFHRVFIVVTYIFFCGAYLLFLLYNLLFIIHISLFKKNIDYDYIVVFGSAVYQDDDKNVIINKRIDKAIEISHNNPRTKFVLTGAKVDEDVIEEAYYMRDYMMKQGVSESKILVDVFSNNTNENIKNALYIIKEDVLHRNVLDTIVQFPFSKTNKYFGMDYMNIGFLSNDWHLMRIKYMINKMGLEEDDLLPVYTNPIFFVYYNTREILSMFKAIALGEVSVF